MILVLLPYQAFDQPLGENLQDPPLHPLRLHPRGTTLHDNKVSRISTVRTAGGWSGGDKDTNMDLQNSPPSAC